MSGDAAAVEDDGRGGGVDELFDAEVATAVDDCLGTIDVGGLKFRILAPDPNFGCDVEDGVLSFAGGANAGGVCQVCVDHLDAELFDVWPLGAADAGDVATLGEESLGELESDKSADSGDEHGAWWQGGGFGNGRHGAQ